MPIADGTWKRGRASGGDGIIPTDKNLEMPANNAIDGKFTITEREKGRRCPLCGKIFAVASGEYDDHFHAELVAVAENDLDTWETNERAAECDALEANIDCIDDDDDAPRVYILGGRPSTAVPKDPKKFRPSAFKLGKKKAPPTLPAANHYADGGGLLGGEELGIDGHNLAGLKWEGMGASFNV